MSVTTHPRSAGRSHARLGVEALEARETPATLVSTDFSNAFALPGAASVLGTSGDGRYMIFQSDADNVVQFQREDKTASFDLFWADTITNTFRLVSAAAGSKGLRAVGFEPTTDGQAVTAVLSRDGLSVAFVSKRSAAALVSTTAAVGLRDAGDSSADVYWWNSAVTAAEIGLGTGLDGVYPISSVDGFMVGLVTGATNPAISADGKTVAFVSNINAGTFGAFDDDGDNTPDVFRVEITDLTADPLTGATVTLDPASPVNVFNN
ncbi:MAG: hypothetical protein ACRC7O_03980, partial [Fimbriiglobus sp.]